MEAARGRFGGRARPFRRDDAARGRRGDACGLDVVERAEQPRDLPRHGRVDRRPLLGEGDRAHRSASGALRLIGPVAVRVEVHRDVRACDVEQLLDLRAVSAQTQQTAEGNKGGRHGGVTNTKMMLSQRVHDAYLL